MNRSLGRRHKPAAAAIRHTQAATRPVLSPPYTLSSASPGNEVIKQLSFESNDCLPNEVADQKLSEPMSLLTALNAIFETNYSLHEYPHLKCLLFYCIIRHYDLGMSYGILRNWWHSIPERPDLLSFLQRLEEKIDMDRDKRREYRKGLNLIDRKHTVYPRRVWDLLSNRVLPFWASNPDASGVNHPNRVPILQAVSHGWVSTKDLRLVSTPINEHAWPVPIPKKTSLDNVRIEMLNLRKTSETQYVWLDVLCLRQKSKDEERERLRCNEWEIDVPTIGTIYEICASTIIYLNGLGLPLNEHADLNDERHWCNRAWTLQEWLCGRDMRKSDNGTWGLLSLGGVTEQHLSFNIFCPWSHLTSKFEKRIRKKMAIFNAVKCSDFIIEAAAMMSRRKATNETDRIAALAYLVCDDMDPVPVFRQEERVEDAWMHLIRCMKCDALGQLLFLFPFKGSDGNHQWIPSWEQLLTEAKAMTKPGRSHDRWLDPKMCPAFDNSAPVNRYTCWAVCLKNCTLLGFDRPPQPGCGKLRIGTATFWCKCGQITLNLVAYHPYCIPRDRNYCLLSNFARSGSSGKELDELTCYYWAVGYMEDKLFYKISVLEIDRKEQRGRNQANKVLQHVSDSWPDGDKCPSEWIQKVTLA